ncbi:MAG: hypothetical protein JW797_14680 [Bradymonadales bacterium]|nr:hypothetical protein [Bradymonadales bacterium]
MRTIRNRIVLLVSFVTGMAGVGFACQQTIDLALDDGLSVAAGPLSSEADYAVFGLYFMGLNGSPVGARVSASGGIARAHLGHVSENASRLVVASYNLIIPSGAGFPTVTYHLMDQGLADNIQVVSGSRQNLWVETAPLETAGPQVSYERFVLEPDYLFDETHVWSGSLTGGNITRLVIDGLNATYPITVSLSAPWDQDLRAGLFSSLPDGVDDIWPQPPAWLTVLSDIELDTNGDKVLYLVAKPASTGSFVHVTVTHQTPSPTYYGSIIRVSGIAEVTVGTDP